LLGLRQSLLDGITAISLPSNGVAQDPHAKNVIGPGVILLVVPEIALVVQSNLRIPCFKMALCMPSDPLVAHTDSIYWIVWVTYIQSSRIIYHISNKVVFGRYEKIDSTGKDERFHRNQTT